MLHKHIIFRGKVCLYIDDHEKYDVAPEEVMCSTLVEIKSWGTACVGRQSRNHLNYHT